MAPEEPIAKDAYNRLAEDYAEDVRENAYNAELEFPGTSTLIPDVHGKRVLDAGCGTGVYTEYLLEEGAEVVGIDVSSAMLAQARETVGNRADFLQADLGGSLRFLEANSFDAIVSALALGYVRNWETVFSAFERTLRPGGSLVFSTGHPMDQFDPEDCEGAVYFDIERLTKEWAVDVPYYRRPFAAILNPLLETGFQLDRILEPQPTERFKELRPARYEKESRHPVFVCVRAHLP